MNPTEQKERRDAVKSLETEMTKAVKQIHVCISDEASDRQAGDLQCNDYTRKMVGEETVWRNKLAKEQVAYVDAADSALARNITFINSGTTFWQRLRWVFTGRFIQ